MVLKHKKYVKLESLTDKQRFAIEYNQKLKEKSAHSTSYDVQDDYLLESEVYAYIDENQRMLGGFIAYRGENFRWKKVITDADYQQSRFLCSLKNSDLFEVSCLWKSNAVSQRIDILIFWLKTVLQMRSAFQGRKYFISGSFNNGMNKYYHIKGVTVVYQGDANFNGVRRSISIFAYRKNDLLVSYLTGLIPRAFAGTKVSGFLRARKTL